ncbi:MAG TPA: hypothetical protein VIP11_01320 [Gemmatimonadaceae bacterium]
MIRKRVAQITIGVLLLGACKSAPPAFVSATPAPAPDSATTSAKRFYAKRPTGSEAQFNPLSLIVNGGFDQLRTAVNRDVTAFPYGPSARQLWRSTTNPVRPIRNYGWKNWLRNEVFPLSGKGSGGGQWYPNYHLHLFAGGMTYVRTIEWYEQHGVAHPRLAAGTTVFAWHVLTEVLENGTSTTSVDGLTDLLIFDPASILLWNQPWMSRPFGRRLEFTNWPGQPSYVPHRNQLENAYMMAMLRAPLPRTERWKVMTTMGNAFLLGISRRLSSDALWLSVSGGFDPADNPVIDETTDAKTATLHANAGIFLDRDGSLLVSAITKGGSSNGLTVNVYPGAFGRSTYWPGLWAQAVRGGGARFGIATRLGFGLAGTAR